MTKPPTFVELPMAPRCASPVPELTSLHGVRRRGPYGNSRYRGNCGGYLIRDLLRYYQPQSVLDPMRAELGRLHFQLEVRLDPADARVAEDRDAIARLDAKGVRWTGEIGQAVGGGRLRSFTDPDGNLLQIVERA